MKTVFTQVIFFIEFISLLNKSFGNNKYTDNFFINTYFNWYLKIDSLMDFEVYGQILYSQFVLQFLIVGLILFLALIGVVFLVIKPIYKSFKSRTSFSQLSRNYLEQNSNQMILKRLI